MRFQRPLLTALIGAASILVFGSPAVAGEGWEIEYAATGEDAPERLIFQMDDDNFRIRPEGDVGGEGEMILSPEGMKLLDHDNKQVMVVTFDEIEALMGGMGGMMKQMKEKQREALKEAGKDMSPEERAALEAYMPDLGDDEEVAKPEFSFKKTGKKGEHLGYPVEEAEVYEGGKKEGVVWLTPKIKATVINKVIARMQKALPEEMRNDMDWVEIFTGLDGFPLKMESEDETFEATRIERKTFSAGDWEGPTEYEVKSMSSMWQGN